MTITITKTFATEAEAAAWLSGSSSAPAAAADKPATKPAAAADKPATKPAAAAKKPANEHTREEMVAALQALRDAKGKDVAKGVIAEAGVSRMDEIPDDKIDSVYAAAKAAAGAEDDGM